MMPGRKSWIEIVLMPLVVAAVGIIGTLLITKQQTDSAEIQRATELEKTQKLSD